MAAGVASGIQGGGKVTLQSRLIYAIDLRFRDEIELEEEIVGWDSYWNIGNFGNQSHYYPQSIVMEISELSILNVIIHFIPSSSRHRSIKVVACLLAI